MVSPTSDYHSDIFLTPLKPLQKVVTAADVESSLYFVHLATDDDLRLSPVPQHEPAAEDERRIRSAPTKTSGYGVRRKPVPSESLVVDDPSNEKTMAQLRNYMPGAVGHQNDHAHRRRLPSSQDWLDIEHPSNVAMMSQMSLYNEAESETYLRRKPVGSGVKERETSTEWEVRRAGKPIVGPRPMHHGHTVSDIPILQPSSSKANIDVRRRSVQSSPLLDQNPPKKPPRPPAEDSLRLGSLDKAGRRSAATFSAGGCSALTLIRRYDGSQSNVAQVAICNHTGDLTADANATPAGSTLLEIMTPGYTCFSAAAVNSVNSTRPDETLQTPFLRFLRIGHDHTQARHPLSRWSSSPSIDRPRASEDSGSCYDPISQGAKNGFEGLSSCQFDSLWGGRCDFSSSIIGRSLKCKHILRPGQKSQNLSELRFNLPNSAALGPTSKRPPLIGSSSEPKRSSFFTGHKRQSLSSSTLVNHIDVCNGPATLEDRIGRLDLSLGQELAGGGFGGKQAKLGKLIIEPEGLKMLDLVVAANIAVWWKVYEKLV